MFFTSGTTICDYDFDFLKKHISLINAQLASIQEAAKGCGDPDQFGMLDDFESVAGLGFVACQRYVSATAACMKLAKRDALQAGPKHNSGLTIAEVINHAANYWKHAEEWDSEVSSPQRQHTEAGMKIIGALPSDYPVSFALVEIASGEANFESVLEDLKTWRDELRRSHT